MVKTYRKPITLIEDVVAANLDTNATIKIALGAVKNGTDATGFANDTTTYNMAVLLNGGGSQSVSVVGSAAQTVADLVTEINADLTGRTATHTDGDDFILITYDTGGVAALTITDGVTEALIASLFGGGASIGAAVDGTEGTIAFTLVTDVPDGGTDDFAFIMTVRTSTGLDKAGLLANYSTTTGILTVTDNGSTTQLADGDKIVIVGTFY